MTAKEMFEKLGFKQIKCINLNQETGKRVRYEKISSNFIKITISFYDDAVFTSLYNYDDKLNKFEPQGGCAIYKELLEAINKQCEELGWL